MTQNVSDPKLLHLVRKLVVTTPTIIISTSDYEMNEKCDEIVATLRTQHREYQRKDSQMLKASVEAAIRQIAQSSTPSRSKRKQQQQQEEEYEAAARAHEAAVGSGGLNLGLRNSYKLQQKQQQRESTLQTVAELLDPQEGKLNQIKRSTSRTSVTEENSIVDGALHTQNDHRVIVVAERRPSPTTSNNNNNYYGEKSTSKALPRNNKKLKRSISRRSSLGEVGAPAPSLVPNAAKSILEPAPRPSERYSDLGGMAEIIQEVRQLVEYPLTRPELYRHLGVDPPRGVLLRGPPGT
jgi:ATP-dependent 26S proteasome regulatory subunit